VIQLNKSSKLVKQLIPEQYIIWETS